MFSTKYLIDIRLKREDIPGFDVYPFSLPAIRALDVLEFHPAVTFFVGENGSGKSTLLEAIAVSCGFNAGGRHAEFQFRHSYFTFASA
jgi:predicted ATPase